jgi:hypothetical protein
VNPFTSRAKYVLGALQLIPTLHEMIVIALTRGTFDRVLIYPEEPRPLTVDVREVISAVVLTYPAVPRPATVEAAFVAVLT